MTVGFELLIGPAAEGLASLITDTTKTGSNSALAKGIQALSSKSRQTIFQASRKYIENYQKRHCQLKVLGMREPVNLSAVYTGVKLLDKRALLRFEPEGLEDAFRETRLGGYSASHRDDEKHPGIVIANEKQYLMVLGGPGAGKSTFLRKVGLEALRTFYYLRAEYGYRLIPVLLELKRFEAGDGDIDITKLIELIATEFEICGFPEAKAFTQNALTQGNLLVLLDGLDEVPSANLGKVLQTIRDFVDRYDENRFIASCRVAASGYRNDAFRRFSDVTMADFDDEQIQQFVRSWFSSAQDVERNTAARCWEALQKPENIASKELAHTPLLLIYLCLVYDRSPQFPNSRSRLYKKALRILLEEWAVETGILRDDIYEGLSVQQEEILLSKIAYRGTKDYRLFFSKRELSAQIKDFLSSNLNAPKHLDSEAVLSAIEVQQGILVERAEDTYSFSHLTLQEYLTAQYLVDNNKEEALIERRFADNYWREIFLLLPGLLPSRARADRFLLATEARVNTCIQTPELQTLLKWVNTVTVSSRINENYPSKRIGAVVFILIFSLTRLQNIDFGDGFEHQFGDAENDIQKVLDDLFERAIDICVSLDNNSVLSRELKISLSLFRNRSVNFIDTNIIDIVFNKTIDFAELRHNTAELKQQQLEEHEFWGQFYESWFCFLEIEPHSVLSRKVLHSLSNYLYSCELMIRCKEGAVRVSPDVWAGIESRILTVPADSEAAAD